MNDDFVDFMMHLQNFNDYSIEKAFEYLSKFINMMCDTKNEEGCKKAIKLASSIESKIVNPSHLIGLHYYIANAWDGIRRSTRIGDKHWSFDNEISNTIIYLRKALYNDNFENINHILKSQIYTNLGNTMDEMGRLIEAQDQWDVALKYKDDNPEYGMLLGNKGTGLLLYAANLYGIQYQIPLYYYAKQYLMKSLEYKKEIYKEALTKFERNLDWINEKLDFSNFDKNSLNIYGSQVKEEEITYREWALENKLFLNPLNDLESSIGNIKRSAHDCMHTERIKGEPTSIPDYVVLLNDLRFDYIALRYGLYECINNIKPYYADNCTESYKLEIEYLSSICYKKILFLFPQVYSLFDKVAYVINEYFDIGANRRYVDLKTIWNYKDDLLEMIKSKKNLPLFGLYWLSQDLYGEEIKEQLEPESQDLYLIRNHIIHKYLLLSEKGEINISDANSFSVIRMDEFINKTINLLKLSRSAIMYLIMAIQVHKRRKWHSFDI